MTLPPSLFFLGSPSTHTLTHASMPPLLFFSGSHSTHALTHAVNSLPFSHAYSPQPVPLSLNLLEAPIHPKHLGSESKPDRDAKS